MSRIQTIGSQIEVRRDNGDGAAEAGVIAAESAVGQRCVNGSAASSDNHVAERRAMNFGNYGLIISDLLGV
jgi:hypothetical protein